MAPRKPQTAFLVGVHAAFAGCTPCCGVRAAGESCPRPAPADGAQPSRELAVVLSLGLLAQAEMGPPALEPLPGGAGLPGPSGSSAGHGPRAGEQSGELTSLLSVELRGFSSKGHRALPFWL